LLDLQTLLAGLAFATFSAGSSQRLRFLGVMVRVYAIHIFFADIV